MSGPLKDPPSLFESVAVQAAYQRERMIREKSPAHGLDHHILATLRRAELLERVLAAANHIEIALRTRLEYDGIDVITHGMEDLRRAISAVNQPFLGAKE